MRSNLCSKCGNPHDRPNQRHCAPCHAAYMREWRKTNRLNLEHRFRDSARSLAGTYKRRGKLQPQPCLLCDDPTAEMHHPDHELPLNVVWLCRACHLDWHSFWRAVSSDAWAFFRNAARKPSRREAA